MLTIVIYDYTQSSTRLEDWLPYNSSIVIYDRKVS